MTLDFPHKKSESAHGLCLVSLPDILYESVHQSQTNTVVPDPAPAMTGLVIMWGFRIFLSQCILYKAQPQPDLCHKHRLCWGSCFSHYSVPCE